MKERPIIFSAPMVRALLAGKKTQTRRVVHPRLYIELNHGEPESPCGAITQDNPVFGEAAMQYARCPYGVVGDSLWVKETWAGADTMYHGHENDPPGVIAYKADLSARHLDAEKPYNIPKQDLAQWNFDALKWKSPLFMRRDDSRIMLDIVDVRVQRLHDITEEDAIAEGVAPLFSEEELRGHPVAAAYVDKPMPWFNYLWHGNHEAPARTRDAWEYQYSSYASARDSYSSGWEMINGIGSWASNPWVWAISFKVVQP